MAQAWSLDRLKKLRAQAAADVEAFDRVIAKLNAKNGHDPAALEALPGKLARAIHQQNGKGSRRPPDDTKKAKSAAAMQAMLDQFSTTTPRSSMEVRDALGLKGQILNSRIGRAVRLQLLKKMDKKKKKSRYLRTDKELSA